jgi:hypothetical protein
MAGCPTEADVFPVDAAQRGRGVVPNIRPAPKAILPAVPALEKKSRRVKTVSDSVSLAEPDKLSEGCD